MLAWMFTVVFGFASQAAVDTSKWIDIPGGSYVPFFTPSRDSKTKAPAAVKVESFQISQSPVTNEQFQNFVNSNSEWRRDHVKAIFADERYLKHWKTNKAVGNVELLKQPVTNISWFSAKAYCQWISARLPSTDEWEYIASLDDPAKRDDAILSWYSKPADSHPKFSKRTFKGIFGLLDMYGKIWEWTSDFNSSMVTGESREDTSLSRSMFCGSGSMGSVRPTEYATFMRYAFRSSIKGSYALPALGFRCAKDFKEKRGES